MQFKDIKANYPVYILDKDNVQLIQGTVKNVTFPHIDSSTNYGSNVKMVVDVTIEANGKTATYTMPESLSVTYAGNLVLATDKESLLAEVESMKANANNILKSMDRQRNVIAKADEILQQLNPVFKEKAENEKRLTNLESSVNKMNEMLSEFIAKQTKV